MNSQHRQPAAIKAYARLSKRAEFLSLDWSLISNMVDLRFQLEHAIDLYMEGDHHAEITNARMLHRAKMLFADLDIALQNEQRRTA